MVSTSALCNRRYRIAAAKTTSPKSSTHSETRLFEVTSGAVHETMLGAPIDAVGDLLRNRAKHATGIV